MTFARLRREVSPFEFAQWRARDRALAKLDQHAANKAKVLADVTRRRGRR